jgi:FtsZ-binding cell division protein ZapB
VEYKKARKRL